MAVAANTRPRSVNDQIDQRRALAERDLLETLRNGFRAGWASACRQYQANGGELDSEAMDRWFANSYETEPEDDI